MKKKSTILLILCMIISIAMPGGVIAESSNAEPVQLMEFPSVAINSVLMKEYTYTPGNLINLNVDLENISKMPNQYSYSIELYENQKDANLAKKLIHIQKDDEIYVLKPTERKIKNIIYTIPSFAKGNLILSLVLYDTAGRQINIKDIFLTQANGVASGFINTPRIKVESAILEQEISKKVDNLFSPAVQKSTIFEDGSLVLFNENEDIIVHLVTEGYKTGDMIEVVYGADIQKVTIKPDTIIKLKPISGENQLSVSLYDSTGVLLMPSITRNVYVRGIEGVIQAFGMSQSKTRGFIKKGDILNVYVDWVPQSFAFNQQDLSSDPLFNTPFTARIYMYDSQKVDRKLIGSSTLSKIDVHIFTDIQATIDSNYVLGRIEIYSGEYLIKEYEKVLLVSDGGKSVSFNSILLTILIILGIVLILVFYMRKRNKMNYNKIKRNDSYQSGRGSIYIILLMTLSTICIPSIASAQWQSVASGVLNHFYPRSNDSSTTTWSNVIVSGYPSNYSIPAYSQSCPVATDLTGASSNYVAITNPMISTNGKTYRWEYSWYPTQNTGMSVFNLPNWFSLQETYAGSDSGYRYPTYPAVDARPVIPSNTIFSQSAFIDQNSLNRTAQASDNIFSSWNNPYSPGWGRTRPFRFAVSSDLYSALATSTYSNIIPWLQARFNAFDRRPEIPNTGGQVSGNNITVSGKGYLNYGLLNFMLPGSYVAASGRLFYSLFSNSIFTSTTTTSLLQSTGYTDQDLLFSFDAGSFMNDYAYGTGPGLGTSDKHRLGAYPEDGATSTRLDCISPSYSASCINFNRKYLEGTYSRPGTYNLMNILVNSKLNSLIPIDFDGRGAYQCQANNAQVYKTPYEVVDNSYIAVVMFNDENADGIKQSTEKSIVSADNSSEGFSSTITNGTISQKHKLSTSCTIPKATTANKVLPFYYATSTSQIGKLYDEQVISGSYKYTSPVPYIRTDAQVINPTYLSSFSTTSPSLKINNLGLAGYQTMNTPNFWIQNSGMATSQYTRGYDSQGRLILKSMDQNCGQVTLISDSLGYLVSGTSTLTAEEFSKQTSLYPLTSDVANNYTAYSKFAVNSELSPTYTVGIDPSTLSTGWIRTKESTADSFEKTVSVTGGNQNYVVYLGVAYSSPGICGSATTTNSQTTTAPSANLCSVGSSTAVTTNDQNFTWSCSGVGAGSADTSCVKSKCPTSSPYYCAATNMCVADVSACTIAGVCGSATTYAGNTAEGPISQAPSSNLCSVGGLNGLVAGQSDPVSSFTWTCLGQNGGATSPTCTQPKCSAGAGMKYCSSVNECRASCPTSGTSTLIFNSRLNPWVVRDKDSSCVLSWNVFASQDLPVACTLNGSPIGSQSSIIQRSSPVPIGNSTLSCTNGEVQQSTTTKCLLNPSFKEI